MKTEVWFISTVSRDQKDKDGKITAKSSEDSSSSIITISRKRVLLFKTMKGKKRQNRQNTFPTTPLASGFRTGRKDWLPTQHEKTRWFSHELREWPWHCESSSSQNESESSDEAYPDKKVGHRGTSMILSWGQFCPWGYMAVSGDIFCCHIFGEEHTTGIQWVEARILLNIIQHTGHSTQKRTI